MSSTFTPQSHDPRWVKCSDRTPVESDFPIWFRGEVSNSPIYYDQFLPTYIWCGTTIWISDKTARTPIAIDAFEPTGVCLLWSTADRRWLGHTVLEGFSFQRQLPASHQNYSHWLPAPRFGITELRDSFPPPRFPEGNPPAGYRWLGEGERVKEGDKFVYLGTGEIECARHFIGERVGDRFDDYTAPYARPLDKQAKSQSVVWTVHIDPLLGYNQFGVDEWQLDAWKKAFDVLKTRQDREDEKCKATIHCSSSEEPKIRALLEELLGVVKCTASRISALEVDVSVLSNHVGCDLSLQGIRKRTDNGQCTGCKAG